MISRGHWIVQNAISSNLDMDIAVQPGKVNNNTVIGFGAYGISSKSQNVDLAKALDVCARDALVFDVAFVDPPYDRDDIYEDTLRKFDGRPLLSSNGVLIFEHSKRSELPETSGRLRKVRTLVQGDSALAFYRRT